MSDWPLTVNLLLNLLTLAGMGWGGWMIYRAVSQTRKDGTQHLEVLQQIAGLLAVANRRPLQQEAAQQLELARFLNQSGFFNSTDQQARLVAYLPDPTQARLRELIPPGTSPALALTYIVQEAGRYGALPLLCMTAATIFNGSQEGAEWAALCRRFQIPIS